MSAYGTFFGSFLADMQMSAVAATPYFDFAFGENFAVHYVSEQRAVTFLVSLLDGGYASETLRKLGKALFFGGFRKFFVHFHPFVVLAGCGSCKICDGVAYSAERFEPQLCVLFLVESGFREYRRYLLESRFFSRGSKIIVLVARLTLARKRRPEIFFGLSTFEICHNEFAVFRRAFL